MILLKNYICVLLFVFILSLNAAKKPNVLFILTDDFGWKDVGFNGSTFYETPNLDKLSKEWMKFNVNYAASPMCSPTRVSIMTGKAPSRHGVTQWLPGDLNSGNKYNCPPPAPYMKKEELTLGEAFKEAGYETSFLGKWHMGPFSYARPKDQGFDSEAALVEINNCSMFHPFHRGTKGTKPGIPGSQKGDYYTDKLTDLAIEFVKEKRDKPFFLYLSHFAMHSPIKSKQALKAKFAKKAKESGVKSKIVTDSHSHQKVESVQSSAEYAGELFNLDENIGRVVDALKSSGQYDDTIIVFTGDNGGRSSLKGGNSTSVWPFRGGKTFVYEGGIRTPLLIHWPGKIKPGSFSDVPVISMDFYPTLLEMCGLSLKPQQHVDGVSLVPLMTGEQINREALFFHFPHYQREGASPASAIRVGDYKLVVNYHHEDIELFNLSDDLGEQKNLASEMPEKAEYLKKKLMAHLEEAGARVPELNKSFKPGAAKKKKKGRKK